MLRPVRPVNVVTREDLGFRSAKTNYHTHSLHPYPAKFIPQIAQELVSKFSQPESMVADIFAGSGTTNLEAMRLGRHSYALDVNPVAALITTAKTAIVQPEVLARTILEIIIAVTADAPRLTLQSELIQGLLVGKDQTALLHWFPENNIVELALILDLINRIEGQDLKALLLLIFSSSLKLASNWLDWSVKPQRDRRPQAPENPDEATPGVRYQRVVPPSLEVFSNRGKEVLKRYTAAAPILRQQAAYRPQIVCADVIEHPLGEDQFDTIITSPPYLTSYEYADLHRLTVLWLHHTVSSGYSYTLPS